MSAEQLEVVRGLLRETDLEMMGPVEVARANLDALLSQTPIPEGIGFESVVLGGVPALRVIDPEVSGDRILLYLHGGAFTIGSAHGYRAFAATVARAANCHALVLDYRLAPEHPFPAAVEDCLAAYHSLLRGGAEAPGIAIAGDSAGGGLVVSLLLAIRDAGLPLPSAGVCLSPWSDLTCAGESHERNAAVDLSIDPDELRVMATRYADTRVAEPLVSPALADLTGLPPLLIHVGSVEILLDDALALARRAGADHVPTTLEIWPGMPHVWHSFAAILSEAEDALAAVGRFVQAHGPVRPEDVAVPA